MEKTIIMSENTSTSFQVASTTRIICRVCQKQFSQYTCPRCNSRYCSLQCYKAHSLRCTESFMRENVMGELQQMQPDDQMKQKMLDILKRFHSEELDYMDEDDSTISEETMQKILDGKHVNLDDLSEEEMNRFQRALASGELSKMIQPWEPWWLKPSAKTISLSHDGTPLVQPLHKQDGQESDQSSEIPSGSETPLPPVRKLSSSEPSPLLAVHLVDIIYSYCFTLRLYNGDWRSDALDAAMVVLSISDVLGEGGQLGTISEALSRCLEKTCSPAYKHAGGLRFGLGLLDDIERLILLGRAALICSLCDLHRLIQNGEEELKCEKSGRFRKGELKKKLKLGERKIRFLMCWVNEQPKEAWFSLATSVGMEKTSMVATDKPVKMVGKGEEKRKVTIEEVQ